MRRFLILMEYRSYPGQMNYDTHTDLVEGATDEGDAVRQFAEGLERPYYNAKLHVFEIGAPFKILTSSIEVEIKDPR